MKGMDSANSSASGSASGVHASQHPKGTVIGGPHGGVVGVHHGGVHQHGVIVSGSSGDSGQSSGGSGSVSPTPRGHMNPHELLDPLIVDTHHGMNSPGLSAASSCGKHDSGYITRTQQQQHSLLQQHQLQQQQQSNMLQHQLQQHLSMQRLSKLSELYPLPHSFHFIDGKRPFVLFFCFVFSISLLFRLRDRLLFEALFRFYIFVLFEVITDQISFFFFDNL